MIGNRQKRFKGLCYFWDGDLWGESKLVQFAILQLLVLDGGPNGFLVPPYRRDEIAPSPELVPREIARFALDILRDLDRTLPP